MLSGTGLQQRLIYHIIHIEVGHPRQKALPVRLKEIILAFDALYRLHRQQLLVHGLLAHAPVLLVHQHDLIGPAAAVQFLEIVGYSAALSPFRRIAQIREAALHLQALLGNEILSPAPADHGEKVLFLPVCQALHIAQDIAVIGAAEAPVAHDKHIAHPLDLRVGLHQLLLCVQFTGAEAFQDPAAVLRKGPDPVHGVLGTAQLCRRHHFHGFGHLPGTLHAFDPGLDGVYIRHPRTSPPP